MSQPTEVEQLKALLERNEREKRALMQQLKMLSKPQPTQAYASPTPLNLKQTLSDSRMPSSLDPSLGTKTSSSSRPMPRNATDDLRPQTQQPQQV
jgi:hypothetical protein